MQFLNVRFISLWTLFIIVLYTHCTRVQEQPTKRPDPHSFARPDSVSVQWLDLKLNLNFHQKKISGRALWTLKRIAGNEIVFDLMDLPIDSIFLIDANGARMKASYYISDRDSILGQALRVILTEKTDKLEIHYQTNPDALALQWLDSTMTLSGKNACLFTQCQSIYARSWIPCQDGPSVRFGYEAEVLVPPGSLALMSARNPQQKNESGIYTFRMEQPIPSYLMALAVGDFEFKPIGERTGVYADPLLVEKAAWEFADLEKMVHTAESLYGPYAWDRYDVIVLPTGFPFGGMENPRLTFLTPSVIAGDRSLTSLLAHELAHSWSGNLVTNSSWEDFWLNEGFTTYFESRIMEALYGKEYADMLSILGLQDLDHSLEDQKEEPELSKLKLDLWDKDPELSLSDVAYEKGKLLLKYLEERIGRDKWDPFLKSYFQEFAFKTNHTEGFLQYFQKHFDQIQTSVLDTMNLFIHQSGRLDFTPNYSKKLFEQVDSIRDIFIRNKKLDRKITGSWSTHEWLYFIRSLEKDQADWIVISLESSHKLSQSGNTEIAFAWLHYIIQSGLATKFEKEIDCFLHSNGRRKFILPLYEGLYKTGQEEWALKTFHSARKVYHPISIQSIEKALNL